MTSLNTAGLYKSKPDGRWWIRALLTELYGVRIYNSIKAN